jgi:hypothetical protein
VWAVHDRIIGPFFFVENTVSENVYLDMLTNYAIPQLQDRLPNIIFQQDGAPPLWQLMFVKLSTQQFQIDGLAGTNPMAP